MLNRREFLKLAAGAAAGLLGRQVGATGEIAPPGKPFTGEIENIELHDHAFSPAEIAQRYAQWGLNLGNALTDGLVLFWPPPPCNIVASAAWDVDLTEQEWTLLCQGWSPLFIQSSHLVEYEQNLPVPTLRFGPPPEWKSQWSGPVRYGFYPGKWGRPSAEGWNREWGIVIPDVCALRRVAANRWIRVDV